MKKNYLVKGIAALALAGGIMMSQAQTTKRCATMENLERLKQMDPDLESRMEDMEKHTQEVIGQAAANKYGLNSVTGTIYQIPVVVHVLYNTTAQNISNAQIQSQIDVLNEDFRRTNLDKSNTPAAFSSLAADCEIQFCLASVAPNGAATTGIVRKSTTVTSFSQNDGMKYSSQGGDDAWPASQYLNIWVCNLGGGLLGYAQFPGGPAATDGVVIQYQYFGRGGSAVAPYNKGRTGSHEVGHWLNLYHIWGDDNGACTGSDQVSDTPNQGSEHYGCPTFPSSSCSNGSNGDMFMNYMDYTDDACMNLFTLGQKTRMRALFASGGAKASLLTSNGCGGTTATPAYCAANGNSVQYEWISNVTLGSINNTTTGSTGGYGNYTSLSTSVAQGSAYTISLKPGFSGSAYTEYFKVYIDYNNDKDFTDAGENVYSSAGTTSTVSGSFTIPSTATAGTTRMRVVMSDASGTGPCGSFNYGEVEDYSINITTASSCGTPSGLTASSITTSSATLGWTAVSGASSYNIRYKPTTSSTWVVTSSSSSSKPISGLSASTQYEFQVQAVCSVTGSYSSSALFKTASSTTVTSSYVTVGTGTATTGATPYSTYYMDERTQFILTQGELSAAGWTSANSWLRSLAFYATSSSGQVLNGFTIKIANTSATSFASTSFLSSTFTTVYSGNVTVTANAWNTYNFTTAFNYSGTGNLLVEICWNNSSYTTNCSVRYTSTSAYRTLYYRADVASGGVCANATGTQSYARPNMRLLFKNSATARTGENEESTITAMPAVSEMNIFPNPASDKINVEFSLPEAKEVSIRFVDMLGRTMLENKFAGQEGSNLINMDISPLERGNYILMAGDGSDMQKKRLLISK